VQGVTRVSILVLLLGSMISPIRQSAEATLFALEAVAGPTPLPAWVLYRDGAGFVLMLCFVALVIFPLCMVKELRSVRPPSLAPQGPPWPSSSSPLRCPPDAPGPLSQTSFFRFSFRASRWEGDFCGQGCCLG
jgi:hypothetical protein